MSLAQKQRQRLESVVGIAMDVIEAGQVPAVEDIAQRLGVKRDMAKLYHLALSAEFEKRRRVSPVETARVIVVAPAKPLSACEQAVFDALAAGGGSVVAFETLGEALGGISVPYLQMLIRRLRLKGVAIDTAWGTGYALSRLQVAP